MRTAFARQFSRLRPLSKVLVLAGLLACLHPARASGLAPGQVPASAQPPAVIPATVPSASALAPAAVPPVSHSTPSSLTTPASPAGLSPSAAGLSLPAQGAL